MHLLEISINIKHDDDYMEVLIQCTEHIFSHLRLWLILNVQSDSRANYFLIFTLVWSVTPG